MDYWELRKIVSKIIPRRTQLYDSSAKVDAVREKGRKSNYRQFDLRENIYKKHERLLNTEEITNFLEISCRASACPMPLNIDIWDGLLCVAEGELVTTKNGQIPIENVAKGDMVLSLNENTREVEYKPVTGTNTTEKEDMVEIETEEGVTLLVTDDHPIYTQRGWVLAGELMHSDLIFTYGTY